MAIANFGHRIDRFVTYVRGTHERKALFFGACFGLCWLAGMLWPSILVLSWIAALAT